MFDPRHIEMTFIAPTQPRATPTAVPGRLVVIGGSAGGITALIQLLAALPSDFPFPILVVQHIAPIRVSVLADVLGYRAQLRVKWAEDGEIVAPATVYVAPPNSHLLIRPGDRIELSGKQRVGYWRPAVDVLFQSAAELYGERTIAVILSGMMWDGAKGMAAVVKGGGIAIAQKEDSAEYFEMPAAAIDFGHADLMMSPSEIANALQILGDSREPGS